MTLKITNKNKIDFLETNLYLDLSFPFILLQDWADGASFRIQHRIWYTLLSSAVQYVMPIAVIIVLYYKIYVYLKVILTFKVFICYILCNSSPFQGSQSAKFQLQGAAEKDK